MATAQEYAEWLRANQDKRGTADYKTVLRGFQEARLEELRAVPAAAVPQPESGFMPALRAGAVELGGGISALAGRLGLKETAEAEKEYEAARKRAKEIYKPTEEGWTEAPLTKFAELLGGSLPYMAAPLAAGVAAAALPVTGTAATVLGLGAAGLTSAGQFTATNLSRQLEEGKKLADTNLGAAALAAIPQAALDTLSMRMIPGIGRIFGQSGIKITEQTAKDIAEQALKKTLIDYTVKTGKTAGIEGATEAAQQVFERLQAGLSITDEKAREEYFDSFIGGAVLGGTLSVPGRFVERGREKAEARGLLQKQADEQRRAEAKAEEDKKKDPTYLLQKDAEYTAAMQTMQQLQAAIPKRPGKDADPLAQQEYNERVAALKQHVNEVMRPLAAEIQPLKAAIARAKEQQRVAGLTEGQYLVETLGEKAPTLEAPAPDTSFVGLTEPAAPAPAPEAQYAQQQMQIAQQQNLGAYEAADFAQYLLQDPAMAQRLVQTKTPIPGVEKKESDAILGMLKLQLQERDKQARAATQAELQQRQADIAAQQQIEKPDPLAMWKASVEQTEDQATDELLRPNLEMLRPTGPATVAVADNITPIQNPTVLLNRLDMLTRARDKAAAETEDAFAAGNRELGVKKAQEREAAQVALNNMAQMEGAPRALMELRKAQDTALMNVAQLIDDLKVGRTLGGPEAGTASSTPQTLINQINAQRDAYITATVQEAAANRRLFGKSLTQEDAAKAADQMRSVFNEWVTRSMAAPRSAVLEERVVQPAQVRGTELVKGAQTELVDPRPLEERRFGAYRAATAVLQDQLRNITDRLVEVPRAPQRVESTLKMQFPATEAAKVAEERGETAKTLEGSLRRRRDYVNNLIDQAFQTRRVPGIAQVLLTRAQDFLQKPLAIKTVDETTGKETVRYQPRGTTAFLDAAENIADRIVRGQNIERSDLVTLRDELRAESARPGEAEVAGERVGQRELFPAEERRALAPQAERGSIGVIRETREKFENAPIVKRARAAAARAQELLGQIKTAWEAADVAKEKVRKKKLAKAEAAVEQQREEYRDAFNAALEKAKIAEITAKFQPQIDAVINQLALFGKERAKALRAKEKDVAKDFETIIEVERENLQSLRQQLADALKSPSKAVEAAEMKGERQVREFTQSYELAAAADDWVRFERDALAKAEAKVAKLKGPEKVKAAKEVVAQRTSLKEAEGLIARAQTGLGLPGVRVEQQSLRAEIAALEQRIPNIKDAKKKAAAENRLGSLRKALGERVQPIEGEITLGRVEELRKELRETADDTTLSKKERNEKLADLNRQLGEAESARGAKLRPSVERAGAEKTELEERVGEKAASREELEDRALTLTAEIEDLRDARNRARTDASKANIQGEIDDRVKEVALLQAQLETPELTRTEKQKARKAQKTLYSGRGVGPEKAMLGAIAQKLKDKKPLTPYEKSIWEGRVTPKTRLSAKGRKTLSEASEALRRERKEAERPAGTFGETLGVEDVLSSFDVGGKDVFFSRGATETPSTTSTVRTELSKAFPDLGRVQVYDSVEALVAANPQYKDKIPSDARGFVDTAGNKAFLIAENINQGQALSVLLHEVGAHIGLKNTLGEAQYNALIKAVETWEKRTDNSTEAKVAKAARARVEAAETKPSQVNDELLAYAIEEAVNAGVKPMETKGPIGQWLSRVAALFRKALEKFGLPPKALDAQGLVDMAFGAAKMEMRPAVPQMSRRQFLRGAGAALGAMKLPPLSKEMNLKALRSVFEGSLSARDAWFGALKTAVKGKGLGRVIDQYEDVYEGDNPLVAFTQSDALQSFLYNTTYDESYQGDGYDYYLNELLSGKDGVKVVADLQQALRAQGASLVEAAQRTAKEKGLPEVGELFFTYAGEKSGVAPDALRKAKDLQIKGVAPEKIWNDTGWFQGPDKKWRYEIDDSKADFSGIDTEFRKGVTAGDKEVSTLLGNIMQHAELYKAYPELESVPVTMYEDANSSLYGSFNGKEIKLNVAKPDPEGTIIHEIQHYIQDKEGLGRGGNTTGQYMRAFSKKVMESVRASYVRQMEEADTESDKAYYGERVRAMDAAIAAVMQYRSAIIPALWAAKKEYQEAVKAVEQARKAVFDFEEDARKLAEAEYEAIKAEQEALKQEARALRKQNFKSAEAKKLDAQVDALYADARAAIDRMYNIDTTEVKQVLARAEKNREKMHNKWLALRYDTKDELKDVVTKAVANTIGPDALFTKFVKLSISEYAYQNLLGEVEARDVGERRTMSEAERQATRPYSSQPQRREEILFSRKPSYAPGVEDAGRVADKVVATPKSFIERVKPNLIGLGFRTQFIDKLAPIEQVARGMADALKATQMMYYLRMYDQRMNFTSQAVGYGAPQLVEKTRRDGQKEWVLEATKGANIKDIVKLLSTKEVKNAAGSPDAANRLFTLYLAAKRADRVGLNALNFGGEVTEADLKAAVKQVEDSPVLSKAFKDARDLYNEYNRDLIRFAVQTGAINEGLGKTLIASNDYIPYYRVREGNAELIIGGETPIRVGNLKDSPHLQELVGGTEKIMNFLDSSVQNTSMLLDMSLRNVATKNAMFELHELGLVTTPRQTPRKGAPAGAINFKKDGVDYFVVPKDDKFKEIGIPADLLIKGMEGIPTMFPAFTRVMGIPARFLRRAVVASPPYIAKALFRDSLSAFMVSGSDAIPVLGALKQIGKESPLSRRGVTGGQVFTGMPEDMARLLQEMQEGRPGWSKALSKLEAASMEADALTRKSQYESYISKGLSEMEATLMSLESMNFSRRGLSPSVHMATTLIPFMNAQIQSMDVLYRTFRGQMPFSDRLALRERMLTTGLMLASMTIAYALYMQDDETYKNARPDEKYNNWFVRMPFLDQYNNGEKVTVRVPIPFELGYIFKALPEAIVNTLYSKHGGEDALEAFKRIGLQLIPGGTSFGLPQAIKPLIEVGLGKSFYTGRDIESAREQAEMPGTRYRDNTSEAAKLIGSAFNISPIKLEALISGYTGSMGLALMQSLNVMLPSAGPEKAAKRVSDLPVVGALFQPDDASGIIDATYKSLQEVTQLQASYKALIERGEYGKAQTLIQGKMNELSLNAIAGNYKQQMGDLTKAERLIRASAISPDEKRQSLDAIKQMKIQIATYVRAAVDKTKSPGVPA